MHPDGWGHLKEIAPEGLEKMQEHFHYSLTGSRQHRKPSQPHRRTAILVDIFPLLLPFSPPDEPSEERAAVWYTRSMLKVPQENNATRAFVQELKQEIQQVAFDRTTRLLFSTDASLYQMMPVGVVWPQHREEVIATVGHRPCPDPGFFAAHGSGPIHPSRTAHRRGPGGRPPRPLERRGRTI